jgi:hypothetical protein
MFFIIPFIVSVFTAVKTAWEAFKAIKIIGTVLTVGKLLKAVQVIAFLGSLQRPKIPTAGSELEVQIDPNAGLPIAIGERLTYGNLAYQKTWVGGKNNAEKNQILGMVKILSSGGPIESIEYCQLGDNKVTGWSSNPLTSLSYVTACSPDTGKVYTYENNYHQRWSKGDLTGSVATLAYFNAGGWTGYDGNSSLTGFAWVAEVLKNNNTTFPQSVPSASYLIKGLKWYDWRKDSTVEGGMGSHRWDDPDTYDYSQNGPVVSYNIIRGRLEKTAGGTIVKSWGLHVNPTLIDLDSFNNAANIADAYGWKVNAIAYTTDTPKALLDKIMQCSGGYLISQGAMISVYINAPQTTIFYITDDDIVGDVEIPTSTSYRDRLNSVIPIYPEPVLGYQDNYAEAVTVQKYQDEDGELKSTELHLDYCTDIDQATQLAALELVNSREFLTPTIVCKPRLLQVKTGQTVTLTSEGLNAATQKYLVVGREIDLNTMCVRLKLRSEDDDKYEWVQGHSSVAPDTKTIVGIDWALPGAPDADVFTVAAFVDSDQVPAFQITADLGDIPDAITSIRFDYKLSSDSNWSLSGSLAVHDYDHVAYIISGLKPISYYDIAIYYVNSFGVVTDRTIFNNKLTSKLVSNDTQNVGGVPAGDLVNSVAEAYSLGWDAVNNAAVLAAEMTANFTAVASSLASEASDRANAIAASAAALQANLDALEGQIDSAGLAPAWSNTVTYTIGDIVTDNGSLWKAISNGINHEPPSAYWVVIGHYDSISGAVDGLATQVSLTNANVVTLGNTVTLTASDLTAVKARLTNAETKADTTASALTSLQANVTTQGSTIASQALAITAVQSNVTSLNTSVSGQSTAIGALQSNTISQGNLIATQASQITALNSNVSGLNSTVGGHTTAITGLQTNSTSQANMISAQAGQITALTSNVVALNAANAAQSTAIALLQTNSVSQGANIATQAASITSLGSSLTANMSGYGPALPTTFFGGFGNWTTSRAGTPTSVAASDTYGTIVQDDDFGYAFQSSTLIAAGNNLCTRGVIQAVAGRIYEIKARLKVSAVSPSGPSFNLIALGLDTSYAATLFSLSTQTISSTGTVYEFVGRISDTASAGVGSWGTAAFLRYGIRVNSSPTSMTYQIGEISCRDITDTWSLGLTTTAQSNAITALQTLTTAQGSNISTQADSITSLQSQINDSGADNLVYNPSFESGTATVAAEGWSVAGTYTSAAVQNLISYDGNQGKSQRINTTGLTTSIYADLKTATGVEAQVTAGKSYTLSAYVNATASIFQHRMYVQFRNSAGTVLTTINSGLITSGGWQRLSVSGVAPSGSVDAVIYLRTFGATTTASTAGTIYWDMVQLELGSLTGFRDNIRASTSAISGLQTSVTALGSNVTATATSLTSLTASIGDTGGQNLFYNPSFSGSGTVADGWTSAIVTGGTITNTLPASDRTIGANMQRQVVSGLSSTIYSNLYTASATNFAPVVAGQAYTLSVWVKATAGLSIRPYIFWNDASSANLGNNGTTVTATGAWQQIILTAPAIAGAFNARPQLRVYSGTATAGSVYWDCIQLEQGIYATAWRDNPTASITSLQTVTASTQSDVTTLTARASLTVSTGGAVTGFSISSNSAAGSTFAIQADKFILTSGTKSVSPFSVDTVNNVVTCTNLVVDTLQIKSGAITNYGFIQNSVSYSIDTASEVTFASVTITTTGGWVDLIGTIVGYSALSSGYTYYDMTLYRGSTALITIPRSLCMFTYPGIPSQGASGVYVDAPAAGTYTYSWRGTVSAYSSGRATNITYRSLRAVEFKR